ncbi:hypothetical protein K2X92_02115, partial [Candidatus Gracilibacteria bacterium]|nr:hypothetical protein [Candidatus Gracilibacteria bacterium]
MYLIYGKGKVGLAIASLCEWKGIAYEICDDTSMPESYNQYECIIPSPGVPGTHTIYSTGKVMSELDFAYQFLPKDFQIISVTGTDGKSTTSWIMYNILEKEFSVKKSVYLSGNFEIPFSATILDILKKGETTGIIVVEVSSFMVFSLEKYQSDYSIFTNFKPDHLNWHKDLQEYFDAKMNLILHTKYKGIVNQQIIDFVSHENMDHLLPDNVRIFYMSDSLLPDSTNGETINLSGGGQYTLSKSNFSGKHNAMNILSCLMIADEMNISLDKVSEYLKSIKGLPHRLEIVGNKGGIIIV